MFSFCLFCLMVSWFILKPYSPLVSADFLLCILLVWVCDLPWLSPPVSYYLRCVYICRLRFPLHCACSSCTVQLIQALFMPLSSLPCQFCFFVLWVGGVSRSFLSLLDSSLFSCRSFVPRKKKSFNAFMSLYFSFLLLGDFPFARLH